MILDTEKMYKFKESTQKEHPGFTDSVDCLQVDKLEANLETYSKYLEEILFELKYNSEIKELSNVAANLKKPYTDKINFFKGKNRELSKFIDDGVADAAALRKAMVEYTKLGAREAFKRDQDSELKSAKEDLNESKAGYNDAKKAVEMKIKYINILILEKDPAQCDLSGGMSNGQEKEES